MNLNSCIFTQNDCYLAGKIITPQGIMIHSTGANNPSLKRYVQPDDGKLGTNAYGNHWNQSGLSVCVHGFIGQLADGSVATYQTLPWNYRGWHCGTGTSGSSGNNTHISFEICEDNLADSDYFAKIYQEAVELTAYLCEMYDLNPLADGVVICHAEGYDRGIASNHSDVNHWFPSFGKSMDTFRQDVADYINREEEIDMADIDTNTPSDWAEEAWNRAVALGIFDGTSPQGNFTREQAAVVLDRLGLF